MLLLIAGIGQLIGCIFNIMVIAWIGENLCDDGELNTNEDNCVKEDATVYL